MYAIALVLVVALLSLIVTRVASVALTASGMTRTSARFQARSALTGVGFTTGESELVVNHPVRRRVVMTLMLLGNVGLVTVVAGVLRTFIGAEGGGPGVQRLLLLIGGLTAIYVVSRSSRFDRAMTRLAQRAIARFTALPARDRATLLEIAGDHVVQELAVCEQDWIAGKRLGEARLKDEGIVVLGVARRSGVYLGAPDRDTPVEAGDLLVVYGRGDVLAALDERTAGRGGEQAHARAATQGERIRWGERRADPAADTDR